VTEMFPQGSRSCPANGRSWGSYWLWGASAL